jgi:hypothetical protein
MRAFTLLLSTLCTGCIIAYAPAVQELGRVIPETDPGSFDLALDADLGRNISDGVGVSHEGELEAADGAPVWPCWGLSYRQGLGKGMGLEGRINGSLMLPLPFPVPNGMSLAPVVRVARWGEHLELHTIPRFMYIKGHITVAANDQHIANTTGIGAEVPAILSWEPAEVFAATGTLWLRGYHLSQRADFNPEGGELEEGVPGGWLNFGTGASLNLFLRPGAFRFGLGAGVELVPNPGASLAYDGSSAEPPGSFVVPTFGMSMGAAWGGDRND